VVAVGNAIVDVISSTTDEFLVEHGLHKGAMNLVDADHADRLYALMGPAVETSGGSAANTAAGVASLGGRAAFVGKVADDQFGGVFRHDIRALGIAFDVPVARGEIPTARSLILVTPDAERTMHTYLGVAGYLHRDDLDLGLFAKGAITYCEGYLWDRESAKDAIRVAMQATRAAGSKVAFTLSDGFCVDRHRADFVELMGGAVDILFANEAELCSLVETDDFDEALNWVRARLPLSFLTRSAKGSVVVAGDELHRVPAYPVERLADTTGAGDQYAAGALLGVTRGLDLATCARLGSLAAAEVISHLGPRPATSLQDLAGALLG
jgi:sugar/nucleoside kinase (ribokinase family)